MLLGDAGGVERVASLLPFELPGSEAAIREPRRSAAALLWTALGPDALERDDLPPVAAMSAIERRVIGEMLESGTRAPVTTSAGRLFDGVAALTGLHPHVSYEGQAAMALEAIADPTVRDAYPLPLERQPGAPALRLDWRELVIAVLADLTAGRDRALVAARFHNALCDGIVAVARHVSEARVALTGGCFQNRLLVERAAERLESAGFQVLLHRELPPNDGGIAVGQLLVAAAQLDAHA
jgi:hydrogenase maturation protein HypF